MRFPYDRTGGFAAPEYSLCQYINVIGVTLNTYMHINFDDAEEVKRLENEKKQA